MNNLSLNSSQHLCFEGEPCHPYEPFKCPGDGACISIQYLCDGAADCPDGYYTFLDLHKLFHFIMPKTDTP